MSLELSQEECQLLAELLDRRLDELGVEEHRSETWHYKEILHQEHDLLNRLRDKLRALRGEPLAPDVSAK
jgi:hypothetical protein